MSVSLETRAPFLDHRVAEFVWSLPINFKVRGRQSKWILRQLLSNYIPNELVERPKQGFAVPIGEWLRGPLREWAENLLNETRLNDEGIFNTKVVQAKWQEHISGEKTHSIGYGTFSCFSLGKMNGPNVSEGVLFLKNEK